MIIACGTVICGMAGCQTAPKYYGYFEDFGVQPKQEHKLNAILDDFHDAASKADGLRYFDHFHPCCVFLGTDATERWNLKEFKAFAEPYFSQGKGWTYTLVPGTRHFIRLNSSAVAFDELLDNDKLGRCRGSGVLWGEYIIQYNLTMTIPNEIAEDVAKQSRAVIKEPK